MGLKNSQLQFQTMCGKGVHTYTRVEARSQRRASYTLAPPYILVLGLPLNLGWLWGRHLGGHASVEITLLTHAPPKPQDLHFNVSIISSTHPLKYDSAAYMLSFVADKILIEQI